MSSSSTSKRVPTPSIRSCGAQRLRALPQCVYYDVLLLYEYCTAVML